MYSTKMGSNVKIIGISVAAFVLLTITLYGGLFFAVWNPHTQSVNLKIDQITELQSLMENELRSLKSENENLQNQIIKLQDIEANPNPHSSDEATVMDTLKRVTRQSDSSQSATLAELIEKKLYTIIECARDDADNLTECSLKPGPKGEKGCLGDQGKEGPPGVNGDNGHNGHPGHPGYPGAGGPMGLIGVPGPMGRPGHTGEVGPMGPIGDPSPMGPIGDPGQIGRPGHTGEVGPMGPIGDPSPMGPIGDPGQIGRPGHTGEVGPMGPIGDPGPMAHPGHRGQVGPMGRIGYPGPMGYRGSKGMTGEPGLPGPSETCGGLGWRKVVSLDITDTSQSCPRGLKLTGYSKRSCGVAHTVYGKCASVIFPVGGGQYSRVCGRAKAYQWGYMESFWSYYFASRGINAAYVDGLSFTHGTPRTHIWTFAAGRNQGISGEIEDGRQRCPCNPGNIYGSPPFVGNDYFCESGARSTYVRGRHLHTDPLWDGQGCINGNTCCQHNKPPWFKKALPTPTTNNIEMRVCTSHHALSDANIALEQMELYVY